MNERLQDEVNERKAAEEQVRAFPAGKGSPAKGNPSPRQEQPADHFQPAQPADPARSRMSAPCKPCATARRACVRWRSIHEKLYQSESLANIEFGEYVKSLANDPFRTVSRSGREIQVEGTGG
ncbi:MAG: hypothetical protein MZV64_17560 [Ignavibacteriales bacterium]|nr:hypothetical protein [Ignavibacteriales bacterium]